MAYSDYGGYGYRNGHRVVERSDAVITDTFESVPGMYPGFAAILQGVNPNETNRHEHPNGHVVLGDGPLYVGLYKQSNVWAWLGDRRLGSSIHNVPVDLGHNLPQEFMREWGFENGDFADSGHMEPVEFRLPGGRLFVAWRQTDNLYQLARLEQDDGTVWTGWSGYGVGAGLEGSEWHPQSEAHVDSLLTEAWPDAIASTTEAPA